MDVGNNKRPAGTAKQKRTAQRGNAISIPIHGGTAAMTTPTTPAAVTVATTLAAHPDGITTRALADASGVSPSTVAKTLTAMEADGTATRTPGPANGNRKTADIWHPASP